MNLSFNNYLTLLMSISVIMSMLAVIYIIANIKKRVLLRDGKPYLIRWTIIKTKWFSLKIHKALMSDPADPHDHPWNYTSLILWGGYFEQQTVAIKLNTNGVDESRIVSTSKWFKPGSLLYRRGDSLHRLVIPQGKFCLSLILTTKKWREWGFLEGHKWVSNKEARY